MRLATSEDIPSLQDLFIESTRYANQVGHIDRPTQFDVGYFQPYIETEELYCFEVTKAIVAAARLTETDPPPKIWIDNEERYLYVGKLATSDSVRGNQFFQKVMLHKIFEEAKEREKIGIRLSCLGDNQRLINFYSRIGFNNFGTAQIFSTFYGRRVEVVKFECKV